MRVVLLTLGTRGDVEPLVAFGLGLQRVGHDVLVVTSPEFESFVRGRGLGFAAVGAPIDTGRSNGAYQRWATSERPLDRVLATINAGRRLAAIMPQLLREIWHACQGAEAIVCSRLGIAGVDIAERLGVPCIATQPVPPDGGRALTVQGTTEATLSANRAGRVGRAVEPFFWYPVGRALNRWRVATLQLPPFPLGGMAKRFRRLPTFYHYSPSLIPRPLEWPSGHEVTGFWFLEHRGGWEPPADLVEFLAGGPSPVYAGFGSTTFQDPAILRPLVIEALQRSGARGILGPDLGRVRRAELPETIYQAANTPFGWLFPRVAAVVHHGGVGTTALGMRAGVPTIVVPKVTRSAIVDQEFWAECVSATGMGPPSIPLRRLTADRLAGAITQATTDPAIRARAAAIGDRIRAEDGVARGVEMFTKYATARA